MENLRNKRITLVGGAGFIGHNLALELRRLGAHVDVIDNLMVNNLLYMTGSPDVPSDWHRDLYLRVINDRLDLMRGAGIALHVEDARDYHGISHTLAQIKPDSIVHLAAVAHANRSNKDPYSTFDHSLRTLENALDAARALKVGHFVYLSSSMIYGNFTTGEVDEETPQDPIGVYGALKVAGEKIVISYNQVFELPYTVIRPSALYGPRCVSRRVGQVFIENALRGEPLRVVDNGKSRLDFTYIDDLVHGICCVLSNEKSKNETFNLTYGSSRAIKDLVSMIRDYFPEVKVQSEERDKLMPERGTLSVKKAKRLIGYSPQNPIDVGYPKYIEWYMKMNEGRGA
jgi:nucleoside-diphosphate-sugar epimerase